MQQQTQHEQFGRTAETLKAAAVACLRVADKPILKQLDRALRVVKAFAPAEPLTAPHQAQHNLARLVLSAYHAARQADLQPDWPALIHQHLPQVRCATCPLAQLPRHGLSAEPGHGQDGPLGLPCRLHPTDPDDACLHGFAPHDPFHLRVPWSWADAPGVQAVSDDYGLVIQAAPMRHVTGSLD